MTSVNLRASVAFAVLAATSTAFAESGQTPNPYKDPYYALYHLCSIASMFDTPERAEMTCDIALTSLKQSGKGGLLGMAFTRRADIAAKAQKHHDAIRFFKESISVLTEEADLRHAAIANVGLAGSLRKLGRLSDAEAALELAMGIQTRVLESTPIAEGELGADGRVAYVSALLDSSLGFAEKAEQCFVKHDYVCAYSSAGTACQLQRKAQTDCDQRIIDLQALAYHARTRSPKEPLAARKGSSSASAQ